MAEDDDSKTEDPSGRKLSNAREQGNFVQSQEIKTAAMLMGVAVVVWLMAPMLMGRLKNTLVIFLAQPHALRVGTEGELSDLAASLLLNVGLVMIIPLLFLLVIGFTSAIWQTGWVITPNKLMPDLNKINPLTGFGRLFSLQSVMELAKSVAKLTIVGTVCYMLLTPRIKELEQLPSMELPAILDYLHRVLSRLLLGVVLIMAVLAAADWLFQRFTFMKKMRMSKQEVKDEHKQTEGDPMIKSRLRSLRMQRARQRMMAAVPKADVVVTNPTHFACALKYDQQSMTAPVLVAKGKDLVALRIRQLAEENEVPVVENPPLARALYASVELDKEIPPEHYKAVAEVISYVFRLKGKLRR